MGECRSELPSISLPPHAIPSAVPSSCSPTKQPRPYKQDRSSPASQAKSLLPPAHEVKLSFASGSSCFRTCDAAKPTFPGALRLWRCPPLHLTPQRRLAHVMALLSPELPYQHACRHVHTHSGRRISSTRGAVRVGELNSPNVAVVVLVVVSVDTRVSRYANSACSCTASCSTSSLQE